MASACNLRVSIAMATYNGERFLAEQLASFADQRRLPDELIVCDDGSTDGTLRLVEQFATRAPFEVRIHRNAERLGFSRNFERAISLCSGEIIFLSDQDDVWFPDKIERVCDLFASDPRVQSVLNGQIITGAQLQHEGVTLLDNMRALGMGPDQLIAGCATALRKSWAELLLPLPDGHESLIEQGFLTIDRWINQHSVMLGLRRFVETPLQYFRRHGGNTTESEQYGTSGVRSADLLNQRLSSAPTEAWSRRADVLDLYDQWLDRHEAALRHLGPATENARATIADERNSLRARIGLSSQRALPRFARVMRLWAAGGYSHFNGWKSALNDLARSPS